MSWNCRSRRWEVKNKPALTRRTNKIKRTVSKDKPMKRFENQVAIISGGADGLGKGIAGRIASEGGNVALFDVNAKLLQQTVGEFRKDGFTVEPYVVDISSDGAVQKAVQEVENKFGKIDVMVNSAGIVGP